MRKYLAVALALACLPAFAQKDMHDTDPIKAVNDAVEACKNKVPDANTSPTLDIAGANSFLANPKPSTGLLLEDSGKKWGNAMSAMDGQNNNNSASTGYSVRVFTPKAWLGYQEVEAKRRYQTYTAADMTDADKLAVVRVIVHPDTPLKVIAGNTAHDVEHVVLRSVDKKTVVQPLIVEPITEGASNAMGGHEDLTGIVAVFSLDDLKKVYGEQGNKEFLVTVIGNKNSERNFKVKTKHFKDMPL